MASEPQHQSSEKAVGKGSDICLLVTTVITVYVSVSVDTGNVASQDVTPGSCKRLFGVGWKRAQKSRPTEKRESRTRVFARGNSSHGYASQKCVQRGPRPGNSSSNWSSGPADPIWVQLSLWLEAANHHSRVSYKEIFVFITRVLSTLAGSSSASFSSISTSP